MISLDTNALARYLLADDSRQFKSVSAFIDKNCSRANPALITMIVLCELAWLLRSSYGFTKAEIIETLNVLFHTDIFIFENGEKVLQAFTNFRIGSTGFADLLIRESAMLQGADYIATFDKRAGKEKGFFLLK